MRLDSSGNLGLGVTPSGWGSSNKAIQLPSGAVWSLSGQFTVGANVYDASGGAFTYVANGHASRYRQLDSEHAWYTAPSGTAGNAISFTQAMTLNASGNLLVGTTASYRNGRLTVKDVNRTQTSSNANLHVSTTDAQAADLGGSIGLGGQVGGDEAPFGYISGRKENSTSGNYAGYLAFATTNGGASTAERVRIKSNGQLRFIPLAADPAGAEAGDVYYNSGTNKLRLYDGSTWVDLN
jgi:hypothetical protein